MAWLAKPVRRGQLHSALASLMASEPTVTVEIPGGTQRRPPVIAQPPRAKSSIRRVLLVEDNPVNQELALAMLMELGVESVSAWSGEEALVKMAADNFEVVLMDCQMPKLDGYATTRRLREWERRTGRERTPIVAVTANALNGDASRCFEAGMDRYLSKPFTIEQLYRILESCVPGATAQHVVPVTPAALPAEADEGDDWRPPARRPLPARMEREPPPDVTSEEPIKAAEAAPTRLPTPSPAPRQAPDSATLDERTLDRIRELHRRGGPNLLGKMAELYTSSSRTLLGETHKAFAQREAGRIAQAAHALKSSSSSIGATVLSDLCDSIEKAARDRQLDGLEPLLQQATLEHARVLRALEEVKAA
jgi:CheY-like chemotaxis protein